MLTTLVGRCLFMSMPLPFGRFIQWWYFDKMHDLYSLLRKEFITRRIICGIVTNGKPCDAEWQSFLLVEEEWMGIHARSCWYVASEQNWISDGIQEIWLSLKECQRRMAFGIKPDWSGGFGGRRQAARLASFGLSWSQSGYWIRIFICLSLKAWMDCLQCSPMGYYGVQGVGFKPSNPATCFHGRFWVGVLMACGGMAKLASGSVLRFQILI